MSQTAVAGSRRAAFAATIGNVLEIYDFIAYGIFAVQIAHTFFPSQSDFAGLMYTFVTFAAGFAMRPLGALFLGRYADTAGRKRALSLTLLLMTVGMLIPAICPGYTSIGIAAPLIMVVGRLLQGFSAGGEIGGSTAMLVEHAGARNRGLYGSLQQASQGAGVLLAGAVGLFLNSVFTPDQVLNGGWRIVFLVGLLIGPVGLYVRRSVPETEEFLAAEKSEPDLKWGRYLMEYKGKILLGVAIMVFWTIATYVSNYFTTYSVRELHLTTGQSYVGQVVYGIVMIVACPIVGLISDKTGPRKPMVLGAVGCLIFAYPLFMFLTSNPTVFTLSLVQAVISFFLACYAGCAARVLADVFPTRFRGTGVGISYSLGVTIFGGVTPLAVTALLHATGDKLIVGLYLSAAALISAVSLIFSRPVAANREKTASV